MEMVQASSIDAVMMHMTDIDASPDCRTIALSMNFQIVNPECGKVFLADFQVGLCENYSVGFRVEISNDESQLSFLDRYEADPAQRND
jgi:hypothetical protein